MKLSIQGVPNTSVTAHTCGTWRRIHDGCVV